jgi:hypothetical protein
MSTKPEQLLRLWLPALAHFEPAHPLRDWLVRADQRPPGAAGYLAGLGDYFQGIDAGLPVAALTRNFIAGDAADATWLAVDPAWARPDINGIRLMACGHLQLSMAEAQALAAPLRPVFGDVGMQLEVSTPDHWHLRLPPGTPLPPFAAPEQALGEDMSQHLPQGAQGKRWRVLLNDIQVLLHQNPLNVARRARGLAPVNTLWPWGGGQLPDALRSSLHGVISDDLLLGALAKHVQVELRPRTPATVAAAGAGWLVDLQDLPAGEIEWAWWPSLLPLFKQHAMVLHFASAERWQREPWHRWRLWRRGGC